VLREVVGCVLDDGVSERGFSVDGCLPVGGCSLNSYVQVVYRFVRLHFCCEHQFGVCSVETVQYGLNVCVFGGPGITNMSYT
jgi:hypothetical protein